MQPYVVRHNVAHLLYHTTGAPVVFSCVLHRAQPDRLSARRMWNEPMGTKEGSFGMRTRFLTIGLLLAIAVSVLGLRPTPAAATAAPATTFARVGTYSTGLGEASGETVAYGADTIYVTNSANNSLDLVDVRDPRAPTLTRRIDLSPYGAGPNSVAVRGNVVAVAVDASPKTAPGKVVIFDRTGRFVNQFTVGAGPDMLTFSPRGDFILVANEGEPNSYGQPDSVDPEGSVSILPIWQGARRLPQANIKTLTFHSFEKGGKCEGDIDPRVRIFGPTAGQDNPRRISQNLEPEYITFSHNGRFAYVTLQENNGLAVIDMGLEEFTKILYLGEKDHSLPGNGLDASDRDSTVNIANWPVFGLYQPDAIASFRLSGRNYLITANEGDARDYTGFAEESRVSSLTLDPTAFPNASALQNSAALGRLNVTNQNGNTDGDGDFDKLFAFGARSVTIWSDSGAPIWDSGDLFERITAATDPTTFNSNGTAATFDTRSDNKGPEPEAVAVGTVRGRTYAFVGLERTSGVMVLDISNPRSPSLVQYIVTPGDIGPEIITFVSAGPGGQPTVIVANEISGTVSLYGAVDPDGAGSLSLLHNNDGESSLLPINNSVGSGPAAVSLPTGSAAAFKTLTDQQIAEARGLGNAVVNVYAGDAFLASSTLACSLPPNPASTPVYDGVAQRQIAYDAHIIGNHEFDFSPDFLERFIRSFTVNGVRNQPFLSANLDFGNEPGFADLIDADGLVVGQVTDGRVVSKALITIDESTGQRFGIVSATTPILRTISSPRNVQILTTDNASTATLVQGQIDALSGMGIKKIIFVSHLQDINNDRALIGLLKGVDIAVAGGGDELLANSPSQLLPGEAAPIVGSYPLTQTDAAGRTVYIVTTAGNYKYLGRIDATFDSNGEISSINAAASFPRRVIPTSAAATTLGITDAVAPDAGIVATVETPVRACLAALAQPIASTEVRLDTSRAGSRGRETNVGNLVTDGYLDSYDRYGPPAGLPARSATVIAVQNGGGIRQNAGDVLPVGGVVPGNITRQNTLDVLAFLTNAVSVVQGVTPTELKSILERSVSSIGGGQFLQIGGLRIVVDLTRQAQVITSAGVVTTEGQRVLSAQLADGTFIIQNGAVVSGAPNVSIVTNSFTAAGGDNYPWLAARAASTVQFPATYEQALVEYLLTFPAGASGLPTISASDLRYAPGGENRIDTTP